MELSRFNIKQQPFTFSLLLFDQFNEYNIILINSTRHELASKILYIDNNYPEETKVCNVTFSGLTQTQNLTLLIQKRTDPTYYVVVFGGIKINDNEIEYIPQKYIPLVYENGKIIKNPLKIEFIGGDLSCGLSLSSTCPATQSKPVSTDATSAFTTLTAKKLKALEHRIICSTEYTVIDAFFETLFMNIFYSSTRTGIGMRWNHKSFVSDVVVIDLGKLDYMQYRLTKFDKNYFETYKRDYNSLLDLILLVYKYYNPNLKVVAITGVRKEDQMYGLTESIVRNRTEINKTIHFKNLYHLGFNETAGKYADCYSYPNATMH
ncbi:hypothetical protein ABK040_004638 [Willaertia magna]